jgi:hypothetical protein
LKITLSQRARELAERLIAEFEIDCGRECEHSEYETPRKAEAVIREAMQLAQPQWISVEERKPQTSHEVIICYLYSGQWIKFLGCYGTNYESDLTGWWTDSDEFLGDIVTHWAELPADPEPPTTQATASSSALKPR